MSLHSSIVQVLVRQPTPITLGDLFQHLALNYKVGVDGAVWQELKRMCREGIIGMVVEGVTTFLWLEEENKQRTLFFSSISLRFYQCAEVKHVSKQDTEVIRALLNKCEETSTMQKSLFYKNLRRKQQLVRTLEAAKSNVRDGSMLTKMCNKVDLLRDEIQHEANSGPENGGIMISEVGSMSVHGEGLLFVKILCMGSLVLPVVAIMGGVAVACAPYVMKNGQLLKDGMKQFHERLEGAVPCERLGQAISLCKALRDDRIRAEGKPLHVCSMGVAISPCWVQCLFHEFSLV